ncbi:hypothetical protein Rsub_07826 [Raphidocelis subcapitata]|uniref:DUF962 domain-containing protein n=1 Tax=Raphidocelis subcapitata TaxID=307507 RepID=A0A2V0P6K8_9CHLO|nr:hypothetical protein Rsub_07826 [Raphidocelis subcapitata]|eukprot:GBF95476.1 hypothetical protein Rsub_07826 [Raphidocelis subcapitata]
MSTAAAAGAAAAGAVEAAGAGAGAAAGAPPPRRVRYANLNEFYHQLYKHEHRRTGTRALHVAGTCLGALQLAAALALRRPQLLLTALATGYGCAWASHYCIEHNRPATFQYPLLSFASDWVMAWNILTGRESLFEAAAAAAAAGGESEGSSGGGGGGDAKRAGEGGGKGGSGKEE